MSTKATTTRHDTTDTTPEAAAPSRTRRGLIAGAAALAAGLLARTANDTPVLATDGAGIIVGANTYTVNTTVLASTVASAANPAVVGLRVKTASDAASPDTTADAIQGIAIEPNPNPSVISNAGVHGRNDGLNGIGIGGVASNGTGAYGQSDSGTAVGGRSTSGNGVYGTSTTGYGVLGYSTGGSASMSGISTNVNIPAFAGGNSQPNGLAANFGGGVFVSGAFTVADMTMKHGLLKHPDGSHRLMYSVESPESWAEDFGTATLVNGKVDVKIDADFAAMVHSDNYHVFLTEYDDHNALYVTKRTASGFSVHSKGGTGNTTFSWRLVVKPKTANKVERLGKFTIPELKLPGPAELAKLLPKHRP